MAMADPPPGFTEMHGAGDPSAATQLLLAYGQGDRAALDQLLPMVYDALHALAHRHLRRERTGHTLSTTALVHEAYLKLVDQTQLTSRNRLHFFGIASRVMRNILIDHARLHRAARRGHGRPPTALDHHEISLEEQAEDLLALDEALDRLAALDPRLGLIVEYRFFGGLTIEETADLLAVSTMTVKRDWNKAKAWLYREIHG